MRTISARDFSSQLTKCLLRIRSNLFVETNIRTEKKKKFGSRGFVRIVSLDEPNFKERTIVVVVGRRHAL